MRSVSATSYYTSHNTSAKLPLMPAVDELNKDCWYTISAFQINGLQCFLEKTTCCMQPAQTWNCLVLQCATMTMQSCAGVTVLMDVPDWPPQAATNNA